jgi:hypothetical protein
MSRVLHVPEATVDSSDRGPIAASSAVVWINGRHAIVARLDKGGQITTRKFERGYEPEPAYLNLVVRAIGDRERVVILGPGSARLALEREYVAMYRRPERLVDVEPAGPVEEADLVDRLRQLAAS